jgi:putative DNA primase/helicase
MIVRPVLTPVKTFHDQDTEAWRILEVSRGHLAETLARAAQWIKYSGRSRKWVPADVPKLVIEAYQGRVGEWKLQVLMAITGTPRLRRDGSLHDTPGYDPMTGLLYKPECEFDAMPERPKRDDAIAALGMFNDLLAGFPFVTRADKAVALSAILTALDRHNMPTAPLHGFSATVAGTGKSKLADIVSILATGRSAVVKAQPGTEDELEKRLNSELLQGATIITIDNCEHSLQSAFLCQMLTQETVSIRVLGQSKNHGDGEQPADHWRPHAPCPSVQPRCPLRTPRAPSLRLGRQGRRQGQARPARPGGVDDPARLARRRHAD